MLSTQQYNQANKSCLRLKLVADGKIPPPARPALPPGEEARRPLDLRAPAPLEAGQINEHDNYL